MLGTMQTDSQYSLRGLNMVTPDQQIDDNSSTKGQSPYTINSRMFAPTDTNEPRAANQSRKGATFYTIPVGETLDTVQTSTTGQAAASVSYLNQVAQLFTPTANNKALTAIDIQLRSNTSIDAVSIAVYENNSGALGNKIAESSILNGLITASYTYIKARFIQGPVLSNASSYWIVVRGTESILTGVFDIATTTAGTGLMVSNDSGTTWTTQAKAINFKTYLSTAGPILGQHRFVTSNGIKQTLFAHGDSIYMVSNESTGAITAIKTGLNTNATRVRFRTMYNKVFIANGYDAMMKWDGTTLTTSTHDTNFMIPNNMIVKSNRAFYINKDYPTRVYFSNIYPDLETVPSTNFFYVPDSASTDPITGWETFQDQLVIFTKNSKWILVGNDISSFSLNQSPGGVKGAVSQEAIVKGETRLFFWSQDDGPNYYDGTRDVVICDRIQPEVSRAVDLSSIDASWSRREVRWYYKRQGSSKHNRMILFDLRYNEWFMDTETYTRLPIFWDIENNEFVEASSSYGALFFGESAPNHLGSPIRWEYDTNYKKYTSGIAKDRVRKFRVIFDAPDRNLVVNVGKDGDFNNSPKWKDVLLTTTGITYNSGVVYAATNAIYGKGSRISQPKISLSGRANNTQFRFKKDCITTQVRVYGYEGTVKSGRMR